MKIAILTLPLLNNYGGILQCYALQTVLQRMGHDVKVLSKPQYGISYYWIYPLSVCKRMFKHYVLRQDIPILKAPHEYMRKYIDEFVKININRYVKRRWSKKMSDRFDAIVVGSDQVWRPEYFEYSSIEDAFLSFTKDSLIKRIAYAASFGVDSCLFNSEQLQKCRPLLQKFNAVSVREKSGIDICKLYFGVDAVQSIDPTLLLCNEDYNVLIKRRCTDKFGCGLLTYILDDSVEKKSIIESVMKETKLQSYRAGFDFLDKNISLYKIIQMPVEQWLCGFRDAKMIVTDSFHGCVFSIIFHKPFIAIANSERGMTRFISLLQLFNLDNRLVFSFEDYQKRKAELLVPIDYSSVDSKLQFYREKAISFLKESLN